MTTKAGEQPTITQDLADELEAVFKRHSLASSYDLQARVYEVANICLQNRKEILNALRTTSLAAQDGLVEALEWYADQMCEGWCDNDPRACEAIGSDNCSGCRARFALSAIKGDKS